MPATTKAARLAMLKELHAEAKAAGADQYLYDLARLHDAVKSGAIGRPAPTASPVFAIPRTV